MRVYCRINEKRQMGQKKGGVKLGVMNYLGSVAVKLKMIFSDVQACGFPTASNNLIICLAFDMETRFHMPQGGMGKVGGRVSLIWGKRIREGQAFAFQYHMARVGVGRLGEWFHGLGTNQGKEMGKGKERRGKKVSRVDHF